MATTLRLWLRRRVLRLPDGATIGSARWTAMIAGILIVAGAAGALAVGHPWTRMAARPHQAALSTPNRSAALAMANEQAAAGWVAGQVAAGTAVGCDSAMCAYLQAAGLPGSQQVPLQPSAALPGQVAVIVATAAVRAQAGAALADQAPGVIASFGTGPEQVEVRVTSTSGAASYRAAARRAVASAAKAGRALARTGRLHLTAAAQHALLSGRVDERVLAVLQRLAAARPVYVTGFGAAGPGAGWPALLRSVSIGKLAHGTGRHRVSDLAMVLRLLRHQRAPDRPRVQQWRLGGGQAGLTIEFPAPSPL